MGMSEDGTVIGSNREKKKKTGEKAADGIKFKLRGILFRHARRKKSRKGSGKKKGETASAAFLIRKKERNPEMRGGEKKRKEAVTQNLGACETRSPRTNQAKIKEEVLEEELITGRCKTAGGGHKTKRKTFKDIKTPRSTKPC